ncbi:DNA-binding protein [Streptomyces albus subsp. albus]|nr:DNA-binding protein [Streptomyces albus subsp. albus]
MKFTARALTPYVSARHYFGSEQRRHREAAKLSLVQLATVVNSSKSTLARIETAELLAPYDLPPRLDAAFGTGEHFYGLYQLAKREAHPDQYRRFMDLEERAETIENYEPQVVPGPLQTEAYARELFRSLDCWTSEQIEKLVAARLSRQASQRSGGPPYRWAIIDESVIRRQAGGEECMYEQLASLLGQADTSHSKVQVVPFSAGLHTLMSGALTLLTLPNGSSVAYEEGIKASHLYEAADAVKPWRRQYEMLRAIALSPAESANLIRKAMEAYQPCRTPPS